MWVYMEDFDININKKSNFPWEKPKPNPRRPLRINIVREYDHFIILNGKNKSLCAPRAPNVLLPNDPLFYI